MSLKPPRVAPSGFRKIDPALLWRPGSSRPRLCLSSHPALPRVALEKSKPSVALAAGFIPAATMSLKPPSVAPSGFRNIETQRYFGGRVHPGRDYVSQVTQRCFE